jgi:hypothetical protein
MVDELRMVNTPDAHIEEVARRLEPLVGTEARLD